MTTVIQRVADHAERVGLTTDVSTSRDQLMLIVKREDDPLGAYLYVVGTYCARTSRWSHAAWYASMNTSPLRRISLRATHTWVEILRPVTQEVGT